MRIFKSLSNFEVRELLYDDLHKSIARGHGRNLYAVNMDLRPDGCRIILKAFTNGRAEIAYINASTHERCWEAVDIWCTTKSDVGIRWYPDAYYRESQ